MCLGSKYEIYVLFPLDNTDWADNCIRIYHWEETFYNTRHVYYLYRNTDIKQKLRMCIIYNKY